MTTTIIGLGLIGGSLGLDLKERGFTQKVIGVDANPKHTEDALELGLVDEVMKLKEAVELADLVILAVPVNAIIKLLPIVLDSIKDDAVVTDMGSTKGGMVKAVENHPKRGQYVASHPMAGTEYSGPRAAIRGMFDGKVAILCNATDSTPEAKHTVGFMYSRLKMRIIEMDAAEHDVHAAYVSHVSHISSFILANTVLEKEKSVANIFNMAGGGFASTVRLAKSSPEMWSQIFEQNADNIMEVINTYVKNLLLWRWHIEQGEFDELAKMMQSANEIRKILK
ncbi:MAG: prephenate dehydrogenase [Chitinophagales bacterium]